MVKDIDLNEVITRDYAYRLIIKFAIVFIVGALLTAVIFYFAIYKNAGISYSESYKTISELKNELLHKSIYIYGFMTLLIITGFIIISIIYSHRVAGPIYRLEHFAQKITHGRLSVDVKIRQNDVIHPLANELNNLAIKYRELFTQLGSKTKEIRRAALLTQTSIGKASLQELKENITKIFESTIEIKKILNDIKL